MQSAERRDRRKRLCRSCPRNKKMANCSQRTHRTRTDQNERPPPARPIGQKEKEREEQDHIGKSMTSFRKKVPNFQGKATQVQQGRADLADSYTETSDGTRGNPGEGRAGGAFKTLGETRTIRSALIGTKWQPSRHGGEKKKKNPGAKSAERGDVSTNAKSTRILWGVKWEVQGAARSLIWEDEEPVPKRRSAGRRRQWDLLEKEAQRLD